jgi:hypothetical protein
MRAWASGAEVVFLHCAKDLASVLDRPYGRLLALLGDRLERLSDRRGRVDHAEAFRHRIAEPRRRAAESAWRIDRAAAFNLAQHPKHHPSISVGGSAPIARYTSRSKACRILVDCCGDTPG